MRSFRRFLGVLLALAVPMASPGFAELAVVVAQAPGEVSCPQTCPCLAGPAVESSTFPAASVARDLQDSSPTSAGARACPCQECLAVSSSTVRSAELAGLREDFMPGSPAGAERDGRIRSRLDGLFDGSASRGAEALVVTPGSVAEPRRDRERPVTRLKSQPRSELPPLPKLAPAAQETARSSSLDRTLSGIRDYSAFVVSYWRDVALRFENQVKRVFGSVKTGEPGPVLEVKKPEPARSVSGKDRKRKTAPKAAGSSAVSKKRTKAAPKPPAGHKPAAPPKQRSNPAVQPPPSGIVKAPEGEKPPAGNAPVVEKTAQPTETGNPPAGQEAASTDAAPSVPSGEEKPPVAKAPPVEIPPPTEFVPGRLGETLYDTICWGFNGGDHKQALEMSRREVADAARDFSRYIGPSLATHLRQIFLEVERGNRSDLEAKLRLDTGWPTDWERVGATASRFLHTVDEAETMIAGVLSQQASVFYQAIGVELELRFLEVALKEAGLGAKAVERLSLRKEALASEKTKVSETMTRVIGREMDFSGIVTAEDITYLSAVAKASGESFLSDPRAKAWLSKRVEAVMAAVEAQIKRKAALEALKMAAMAEKDLDMDERRKVIEDFIRLTREGLKTEDAIRSATKDPELRQAVHETQEEFAAAAEAASEVRMAKALKRLALYDVIPSLRAGIEDGWKEGKGVGSPTLGYHVSWGVTSALRLLWSRENVDIPRLDEEIAKTNVVQAERDRVYNVDRAEASRERYQAKLAFEGGYPDAEDISDYGRARQVFSYPRPPAEPVEASSQSVVMASFKDLLTLPVQNSAAVKAAELTAERSGEEVKKSSQWANIEVGFGGGIVVLDSVLPTLVLTLENLGNQKAAATVRALASSLRQAKSMFEMIYATLHYSNDYLFALSRLEQAEAALVSVAAGDPEARLAAEGARIQAAYQVRRAEAEIRRLLGPGVALPTKALLEQVFSVPDNQLYWGNPLLRQFNMDATLREASVRAWEYLAETQKALAKVPELRIHMTSVLALILSPAMPWMPVLAAIDIARTGFPLLSRLLSGDGGKTKDGKRALAEVYAQILENQKAAGKFAKEYVRQREDLRSMASFMRGLPKSEEERHLFNRWRIASLAFELSPGAEDFLSDRITDSVEKGDLKQAVALWKSSNAALKLEGDGRPSRAGELLRRKLNEDADFKEEAADQILDSGNWLEMKMRLDEWLKDFGLDFNPKVGGRIIKKIFKGYRRTYDSKDTENKPAVLMAPEVLESAKHRDYKEAYQLYRKQILAERDAEKPKTDEGGKAAAGEAAGKDAPAAAVETAGKDAPAVPGEAAAKDAQAAAGEPAGKDAQAAAPEEPARALALEAVSLVREGRPAVAQAMIAAISATYAEAGLDFAKHYPELEAWVAEKVRSSEIPDGAPSSGRKLLDPLWALGGFSGTQGTGILSKPSRRTFRLIPEWDMARQWSSVLMSESSLGRGDGTSESLTVMSEESPGNRRETRSYSFAGPMGPLGELRWHSGGSYGFVDRDRWNPANALSPSGRSDAYYSLGLTQRRLLAGYDLTERLGTRTSSDGTRRDEYGLGAYGSWNGSYNFLDANLLRDSGSASRNQRPATHYRTYGRLGYGAEDGPFSLAAQWQADDLYGYRRDSASGEYNLAGHERLPIFSDPRQPEVFWSGTYYKNRGTVTTGRYYDDLYTKDIARFILPEQNGRPPGEGTASYSGIRQTLASGKYGGIGVAYAAQTETQHDLRQYRTASYLLPGDRGQIDLINSDDPGVGPLAVQAQAAAGPAVVRAGVDASSYTLVVGARTPSGQLNATGRLVMPTHDRNNYGVGGSIGTPDSAYQALWSPRSEDLWLTMRQGDWWQGSGVEFDYRKNPRLGDRYSFKMALSTLYAPPDWTTWVPFAPLFKGVGSSIAGAFSSKEPPLKDVSDELDSAGDKQDLAKKTAALLESAGARAKTTENANRSSSALMRDVIAGMEGDLAGFREQAATPIPYSWKPSFEDFTGALSEIVIQLKQAKEDVLFGSSEVESPSSMWSLKVVDLLNDVLNKYEIYRAAYRDQIRAIPISQGVDKRPQHIAEFDRRSQWFVNYIDLMKREFIELDKIGKMDEAALREQLGRLYRLKEETAGDEKTVPVKRAARLLDAQDWLPTSADIPIRVLDNRINRLAAENNRRALMEKRIRLLKARAAAAGKKIDPPVAAEPPKAPAQEATKP